MVGVPIWILGNTETEDVLIFKLLLDIDDDVAVVALLTLDLFCKNTYELLSNIFDDSVFRFFDDGVFGIIYEFVLVFMTFYAS